MLEINKITMKHNDFLLLDAESKYIFAEKYTLIIPYHYTYIYKIRLKSTIICDIDKRI